MQHPVVVIGAGPVGLAAAAHLRERGRDVLVLEAGASAGAAVSEWGHVRTFTPWRWIVDEAARRLLLEQGWTEPGGDVPPTGAEIVAAYVAPLADALGEAVRTGARVVAVTRAAMDKTRSAGRAAQPFLVRYADREGREHDALAAAVVDASGTWGSPNPLGAGGLPARGERAAGPFLVGPLPDVLGADRARYAGRRTLVAGLGHSAATTLLALGRLVEEEPGTEVLWAIRGADPARLYGGGEADELPARGRLGADLRRLVDSGAVRLLTETRIEELVPGEATVTVLGRSSEGPFSLEVHQIAAATGFRPDLAMLAELRLDLDPGLEAPTALAPLIDPEHHSCGTVAPHGHRDLAHPEPGFYVVGMKSYGRAPTFLLATGNEQVRSVAAAIAGDLAAADAVALELPETGVCSVRGAEPSAPGAGADAACCGTPEPVDPFHRPLPEGAVAVGFATGAAR
ncbi:MAG: NAD(P)-binding protein [Nocardioides sp.]|nr:NAD(P)-binding protein [Nocardioides sp.]